MFRKILLKNVKSLDAMNVGDYGHVSPQLAFAILKDKNSYKPENPSLPRMGYEKWFRTDNHKGETVRNFFLVNRSGSYEVIVRGMVGIEY
jgi:hypothetical protein